MNFRLFLCLALVVLLAGCGLREPDDSKVSKAEPESTNPAEAASTSDSSAPEDAASSLTLEGFSDRTKGIDNFSRSSFFSFAKGKLLPNSQIFEAQKEFKNAGQDSEMEAHFLDAYDIFFDADHGIATNSKIRGWELGFGNGGIVDMGQIEIGEVTEAPESGYKAALETSEILPGHTYCVRTANGNEYGKMHILHLNKEDVKLTFTWSFQSGGSRQFK